MWIGTRMGLYRLDKKSGDYQYVNLPASASGRESPHGHGKRNNHLFSLKTYLPQLDTGTS